MRARGQHGTWARRPAAGVVAAAIFAALLANARPAAATNALDTPSSGVVQVGRGGAWMARADDATAAFFNPAAMVTQTSNVHLGAHLLMLGQCFERRDATGAAVAPAPDFEPPPGEVCADIDPFPNPQLAGVWRAHHRFAIGLAALGPHAVGNTSWPETIRYANRFGIEADHPSPQRYLLLDKNAIAVFPTLSVAVALTRQLSLGAGFTWGLASLKISNMAEAISPVRAAPDDFVRDIRAEISGFDGFIPGFVVSAQYSPLRSLDLAAWYRYSDAIRTSVDLFAQSNYFSPNGQVNEQAIEDPANITDEQEAGTFELPVPMEAKLALRYHHPRRNPRPQQFVRKYGGWARDPISEDLFDLELDLSWAHNSAVDSVHIRMRPGIQIQGTPGFVPENADIPHQWRDVLGVRLGGEWTPIPDLLALRLGGFFESQGVDDAYLNLDFHEGAHAGPAGGVTLRLSRFDISAAYQHTFFLPLDNGGAGRVKTLSGDATTGDFRTRQAVNGGRATAWMNEVALGVTAHF